MSEENLPAAAVLIHAILDVGLEVLFIRGVQLVLLFVSLDLGLEESLSRLVALFRFREGADHLELAVVHFDNVDGVKGLVLGDGDEFGLVQERIESPLGHAHTCPQFTLKLFIRAGNAPQERVKYLGMFVIHIEGSIPYSFRLSTGKKEKMNVDSRLRTCYGVLMLATITDYNERVANGRRIEKLIFEAMNARLRPRNNCLEEPTREEDKALKIDAWLVNPAKKRYSVQIKYRESGDDIIFECVKDTAQWLPGRDATSEAQLYLCVNRQGTARLYWTAPIKALAAQIVEVAKGEPNETEWFGDGWELKRRKDHATGIEKLVAFISPSKMRAIEEWRQII